MKTFAQFKKESMKRADVRVAMKDVDIEFQIIKSIVEARAKKKLTQKELAARIGVAQSTLARFESGKVSPTLSFVKKVVAGLGLRLMVK